MNPFAFIEKLSKLAFGATLWAPAAMVALITYDVVGRALFNSPSLITDEITGYLLVFVAFMGAAEALRAGRHIGVDVVVGSLSQRARLRLTLVALLFSLAFLTFFWWHAVVMVYKSYVRNVTVPSSLLTPIWIPQVFIPIGMTLLLLQVVVEIAKTVTAIRSPDKQEGQAQRADESLHGN
jgi:TRAP-type C4-dicarboxylate transport system permease small subunit